MICHLLCPYCSLIRLDKKNLFYDNRDLKKKKLNVKILLVRFFFLYLVKGKVGYIRTSGKFGHTLANNVNPDETAPYEPSHQDFHCLPS